MERFDWKPIPMDARETEHPPQNPLLPFLENLSQKIPKRWDNKLKKFVTNDDWLRWELDSEIGLRMALGAQLSDVQKLIVRQGMCLAAIGSLIGLALPHRRLLKSFLNGVSASDPITFTLLTIAFLACGSPPAAPAASTR